MRFDVASVLLAVSLSGCAAAARDVAREATPAAVSGGVEALTEPQLQEKVVQSIDEKRVAEATHRLVGGAVDGTMRALSDPERGRELRTKLDGLGRGVTDSAGDVVDVSIERLTSPANQEKLRSTAQSVVSEAITGAFAQTRSELAGTDMSGLGAIAREISKQAALGVQDAVNEAQAREDRAKQDGKGNVLAAAGEAVEKGPNILWLAIAGVAAFAVALLGTILWAGRRQRSLQAELHRRDDALLGLVASLQGSDRKPTFDELEQLLGARRHDPRTPARGHD
jgi:hypothetical protein